MLLLRAKEKISDAWYWWRLYSRLPQRIWYQNGTPEGFNSNVGIGRAGALYCAFEAAIWISVVMFFFGNMLSSSRWIDAYLIVVALVMARDFSKWGWLDHSKALNDCNDLRDKGYWYPEKVIESDMKRMLWAFIFLLAQFLLIWLILIPSFVFFR